VLSRFLAFLSALGLVLARTPAGGFGGVISSDRPAEKKFFSPYIGEMY
jgi:hypothetical protein